MASARTRSAESTAASGRPTRLSSGRLRGHGESDPRQWVRLGDSRCPTMPAGVLVAVRHWGACEVACGALTQLIGPATIPRSPPGPHG